MADAMACPNCGKPLKVARAREAGVEVDHCVACGGIWFDPGEFEEAMPLADRGPRIPASGLPDDRDCPRCRVAMYRFRYPRTLVEIDTCDRCGGVWIDRGEFREIKIIRESLERRGELGAETIPGVKGSMLRFIDRTIASLSDFG